MTTRRMKIIKMFILKESSSNSKLIISIKRTLDEEEEKDSLPRQQCILHLR
jgi:hypothetical protein